MKKLLWLGVGVSALILPGLANATTVRGVVVAKEAARHTLVVSSATGLVTTVRVTAKQARTTPLGTRLTVTGAKLSDGSMNANRLTSAGKATHARLAVVVVKVRRQRLLVAGGGSAFSVRLRSGARVIADAAPQLKPGDKVDTEVEVGDDGVVGIVVQQVGQAPVIEFSGSVAAVGADSITINSDGTATVVQLPTGVTLPAVVEVGVRVEVVATVSGTTLTLSTIKVDGVDAARPEDQGTQVADNGEVQVEGAVASVGNDTITIQPGEGAVPVVFVVPTSLALPSSLAAGARVEARGAVVGGVLTLTRLEVKGGDDGGSGSSTGASSSGEGSDSTGSGSADDGSGGSGASSSGDGSGSTGSGSADDGSGGSGGGSGSGGSSTDG
ncbi:MAG TPA: hypothetical protein VFA05_07015 [Gaiellaceae bacterium]|nr:hypothetical protein [Gaiellaceae bacterium]